MKPKPIIYYESYPFFTKFACRLTHLARLRLLKRKYCSPSTNPETGRGSGERRDLDIFPREREFPEIASAQLTGDPRGHSARSPNRNVKGQPSASSGSIGKASSLSASDAQAAG
ncbi:hypothetical protein CEXT_693311 [Caerostris extrusa]|uniref:Uncharacterized protein n=1 Tax=Caerostris extrusa TaxID=172846 RepID=A0AAV4QEA2_CAEEX|nr:hypothetical protein CEXT_693311 [Caerostris extrusa]